MTYQYINLPYKADALEPYISKTTMELHHDKHYKTYISKTNSLIRGSRFDGLTLRDLILKSHLTENAIFHNASQAWSHMFYWNCMTSKKLSPSKFVLDAIQDQFGSRQEFEDQFSAVADSIFGSGWTWLVKKSNGDLAIEALENAENPITQGDIPLLVCDMWEHAYYLDQQNMRSQYISNFLQVINWDFLEKNLHVETPYMANRNNAPLSETLIHEY